LKVAAIKEVQWNPQTFQSVEIAEESKELIEALVRNKIERDEGLDFVQGKGTGLVVLLHGYALWTKARSVADQILAVLGRARLWLQKGKNSERNLIVWRFLKLSNSVAEIAKKPLFHVTGGDVGTAPETVERVSRMRQFYSTRPIDR
jgi:hypothetical protein